MSLAFLLTSLVIVVTPGTGALFTVATGLSRGARASVVAAFGCTLGIVPHVAAAVTGTAALLRASGVAFEVVRFAGVAYLLYMAWATRRDHSELVVEGDRAPRSARRIVGSAVLTNLLNPKLTIFFFAFLPQFVPADESHQLARMLGLSAVFMAMTFPVFSLYGVFAASVRRRLIDRPKAIVRIRRLFAASFVALRARYHQPLTATMPHGGGAPGGLLATVARGEEVVPLAVEVRGGGRVTEFSQMVEVATSRAEVGMGAGAGARRAVTSRSTALASLARSA